MYASLSSFQVSAMPRGYSLNRVPMPWPLGRKKNGKPVASLPQPKGVLGTWNVLCIPSGRRLNRWGRIFGGRDATLDHHMKVWESPHPSLALDIRDFWLLNRRRRRSSLSCPPTRITNGLIIILSLSICPVPGPQSSLISSYAQALTDPISRTHYSLLSNSRSIPWWSRIPTEKELFRAPLPPTSQ